MSGQVHSAEFSGSAEAFHGVVPAADFAGDAHGGALEGAAVKAVVLSERGGGAIYAIAGRVKHSDGEGAGPPRHQVIGALAKGETRGSWLELVSGKGWAGKLQLEAAFRTGRGEVHGAQELSPGRAEPGRTTEPTPEVMCDFGTYAALRPGVQLKELAGRASGAVGLEAGGGSAVRSLASTREKVQFGGGVEPSVDSTAMRRFSEPDKAAPAEIRRGAVQPASARA